MAGRHAGGERFRLARRIGAGAFGDVYAGLDVETAEEVAIKVEPTCHKHPQLLFEAKVLKVLAGRPGFPRLRHCGFEARRNVMVTDLLGPSLADLHRMCGHRFSCKTMLMVGCQLAERLEALHSHGYIHRDLKPGNILLGRGDDAGVVHLIDFGLAKRFRNAATEQHIPYRDGKKLKGTLQFTSASALRGAEQSRRDDLEAMGYVLLYLLRGSLPWQHLEQAFTKRGQVELLARAKGSLSVQEICCDLAEGGDVLTEYLSYCRGLGFKECPDYAYVRGLFAGALARAGYENDLAYDWAPAGNSASGDQLRSTPKACHAELPRAAH